MKRSFRKVCLGLFCVVICISAALAQGDPDPNSPVPILQATTDNERVFAFQARATKRGLLRQSRSFYLPGRNSLITLLVSNVDLMPGEGASAFRVYLEQKSGKTFELQSEELAPDGGGLYALKVRLFDRDGYRGQPVADGDSLIYVTWRGLRSNVLKIRLGKSGESIKVPAKAEPLKLFEPPTQAAMPAAAGSRRHRSNSTRRRWRPGSGWRQEI